MGISVRLAVAMLALGVPACSTGGVTGDGSLPPDVADPATVKTPAGALAFYRAVVAMLPPTAEAMAFDTGVLTDELAALPIPLVAHARFTDTDSRHSENFPGTSTTQGVDHYGDFHAIRSQAHEARGFLASYAPDSSPALRGHLYAIEGYAEILLADLYCSGIPLSTVDYGGDFTLAPGSTTAEVYTHAAALLDTAWTLTGDSVRLRHLAAIGRGRALLALGRYADAASAVSGVPDGYQYQENFADPSKTFVGSLVGYFDLGPYRGAPSVGDREGINGLDYVSSNDPRTAVTILGQNDAGDNMYFPAKYPVSGPITFTIADWREARLIEAEASLQSGDPATWLAELNVLRTDGTFDTQPNAEDTTKTDTLWHAGSGGTPGLRPLDDPGTVDGRVDLMFRERAFWLYLTGHRQGDMRRLVREYGRDPETVYPTGEYPGGNGTYGGMIVLPVPDAERTYNPKYTGCFHLDA